MPKLIDITGNRYGQLVVVQQASSDSRGKTRWQCRCDCGKLHTTDSNHLKKGRIKSCGCARVADIADQRFGRLVAIKSIGRCPRDGGILWLCQCDCGNSCHATAGNLRGGSYSSCGCRKGNYIHGYAKTGKVHPLHKVWAVMRDRCANPKNKSYKNYGGRGIKVDPRWDNFAVFLADVGERPQGLTLDRIDNDGNYTPTNVRWATYKVQGNNRRKITTIDQFSTAELIAEIERRTTLTPTPSQK